MPSKLFLIVGIVFLAAVSAHGQPANNDFAAAWLLSGTVVTTNGNTSQPTNATKEPGEPNHAGLPGGRSVWFAWTAPLSGSTRISTQGSAFNTLLGVYTGSTLNALAQVASNDNAPGGGNFSRVEFEAEQGTTYRIAIDGRNNTGTGTSSGSYVLTLQMLGQAALTTPTNGTVVFAGTPIDLQFEGATPNPPIIRVDFYQAGQLLDSVAIPPYASVVYDAPVGTNSFLAVMTDSAGLSWTSAVANVLVLNAGVTILTPRDGEVFLNTNSVPVLALGLLPSGAVTNVEFLVNGQKFGESASNPFGADWNDVVPGTFQFTAVGMDDRGLAHTSAPVSIAVARVLVQSNAVWKYFDTGADLGTSWMGPDFDDSTWASGPGQLGYGDGDEATVVSYGPDPNNKFITTYFRHAFVVSNSTSYAGLTLRVLRDDGAIAYLNGVESARFNMPTGVVTSSTLAANAADDGTLFFPANIGVDSLREGTNLLAVEVHQTAANSSDVSFDLELLGIPAIPRNQPPLAEVISPTNGQFFLAPTSIPIEAAASDQDGSIATVEFFVDGTKLWETNGGPYVFAWDNPPLGSHVLRVVASDEQGARTSSAQVNITIYDSIGTPLVSMVWPTNGATVQTPANVLLFAKASAATGVTNVVFLVNGMSIGEDASPPFSAAWSPETFGSNTLAAIAFDAQGGAGTSAVVYVTVNPPPDNTEPPTLAIIQPPPGAVLSNLTSIQVTFSERVTGVDAADLLINGQPASGASGTGSNYTFTIIQPPYGPVAVNWATNHAIVDLGLPPLPFDQTAPAAAWNYTLMDRTAPVVAAKTPPANATVTNLTEITVTFSEPVGGIEAGDLLVNGLPALTLVSSTNTVYTFSFAQPYSGSVSVTWAATHGIADLAPTPNPFEANGPGATWNYILDARTVLVQSNANWLLVKGTAEASTPSEAWQQFAFNDSDWSNAPAPFYYGDPYNSPANPGTLLGDMQNNYSSIYLRNHFLVPNLSAVTNLFLSAQSDDGFVAWINGVEVSRYNMPAGEVAFNAVALTAVNEPNGRGAPYISYALADPTNYLVDGENVLAVQAFNQSLTSSSDFGFNLQLYTYLADPSVAAPALATIAPPPGEVFYLTNLSITFTEPVRGVDAADLLINGAPASQVVNATNQTYTFEFAQPPLGPVTITWATNAAIEDLGNPPKPFNAASPAVTLHYVLLNPSTPLIIGQIPAAGSVLTNLTELTVTFSEPVTGVDAADLLVNGLAATAVTGSGTTFRFSVPTLPFGPIAVTWATNHGIRDLETPPNEFDPARRGGVWTYTLIDPNPTVTLSSPPDGSLYQTPVTLTLQAQASDRDGTVDRVEFFADSERLGEDTNAPYAFTWRNVPAGVHALLAVATDDSGRRATSAPVNITVQPVSTGLILSGAIWKYLDNGTDQSNAWRQASFDDSSWAAGPSELGYGDSADGRPEATVVGFGADPNNKNVTTYFRHTFVVTNTGEFTNLIARLVRDDGAAIYLNGVEIVRANLPAGEITNQTLAATNVVGPDEARFFVWPVDPALLHNGSNVLAAEVHQFAVGSGSADISFDFELIANVPPKPPTIALTSPVEGALFLGPAATIPLVAEAADPDGFIASVEFLQGTQSLGQVTNAPFTFLWTNVALGTYGLSAVAIDNSGLSATTAPISITVTDDLPIVLVRGPYLQSGSASSGVVRWRTDYFSDAVVFYGTDPAHLTNQAAGLSPTNEHIVQLTGLQPNTRYFYTVGSTRHTLAAGTDFWFVTSPVPGTPKPTRLWVLGDPGTANNNQRNVRDAYYSFAATNGPADFWLMLGDNAYNSGTDAEYQTAVFNMYPTTLRNLFLWPAIGNHETAQSFTATDFPYLQIFSPPQNGEAGGVASGTKKYYSFDYANIHFICLDSMTSGRSASGPMAHWLQDDLAATLQEWIIVFFHHPPYTKGNHDSDAELELIEIRQNLLPILEANGVDLVLCGHSHAWERSYLLHGHYGNSSTFAQSMKIDGGDGRLDGTGAYRKNDAGKGVVYTVAGSSGQITGGSLDHPAHFLSLNELGSMIVDVVSNRLDVLFLATNGVARDHFTLLKPSADGRPAGPVNLLARPTGLTEISLAWTDTATNELGYLIERSLDGTNFTQLITLEANATNTFDSGLLPNTTYFYRVRAFNAAGPSPPANIASATTVIPAGTPPAPSDLVASAGNGVVVYRSRIILRWRDRSADEAGFQIERSTDGSRFLAVATVGQNVTAYVDEQLDSGTAYYYRVRSFNPMGFSAPSIPAGEVTHPQSEVALAGSTVTFHAGAEGVAPVVYQWRFSGVPIFGETNQTLTLTNVQPSDEGPYTVMVTDADSRIVSNPAYLFVVTPPHIVAQPAHTTNTLGTAASFSVVVEGAGPFVYQWRKDGVPLQAGSDPQLTLPDVQLAQQGAYDVVVQNQFGSVTSLVAWLIVNLPPRAGADTVYRFNKESLAIEIADLLANDADPDGDPVALVGVTTNSAAGGTVQVNGRYVIYVPAQDDSGGDVFLYTITDGRGGLDTGVVTVEISHNTPPAMLPIPDLIAQVNQDLRVTNSVSDGDLPPNNLTYALELGAPRNARVDAKNGLFHWAPTRRQAPSTNRFTIKVSDDGIPSLSDQKSFNVIVADYFEVTAGTTAVLAGENGSVPIDVFATTGLSNIDCTLRLSPDRVTNLTAEALLPEVASVDMHATGPDTLLLRLAALPGQMLLNTQRVARLHFRAVSGQSSAFLPVHVETVECVRSSPGLAPTPLANDGRVALIGTQPLLQGRLGPKGERELILYGQPGARYQLDSSTNPDDPQAWRPWQESLLTNVFRILPAGSETVSPVFYRARE